MSERTKRAELLSRLRDQIAACERPPADPGRPALQTDWPALDRVLPLAGVRCSSLIELLDRRSGCGAETLAAVLTRAACRSPGVVVVVDPDRQFYPPALAAWGAPLGRQVVVHAAGDADALWAAVQALRSRAAAAVWLRCERLRSHDSRRLQLAAEEGGALGLVFRPARARGQPTFADVQLAVEPRPSPRGRRLRVEVARYRGGVAGAVAEIEFDDVTARPCEADRREPRPVSTPPLVARAAAPG
jgi:protein ImuA